MKLLLSIALVVGLAATAQAAPPIGRPQAARPIYPIAPRGYNYKWGVTRGNRTAWVEQRGERQIQGATIRRGNVYYTRVWDGKRWHTGVTVRDRFGRFVQMSR